MSEQDDDFAAMLEASLKPKRIERGQTIEGRIVGMGPEVAFVDVGGDSRRWLYMHPPAQVTVAARIPERAYFQAGLAIDPNTWNADVGDGVRFILEAEGAAGRMTLLDRHVNPRARADERRWLDEWVSLAPLAGQQVRLTLRTDAAQDGTFDWAGWSNPQVVVWRAARPNPGSAHPW